MVSSSHSQVSGKKKSVQSLSPEKSRAILTHYDAKELNPDRKKRSIWRWSRPLNSITRRIAPTSKLLSHHAYEIDGQFHDSTKSYGLAGPRLSYSFNDGANFKNDPQATKELAGYTYRTTAEGIDAGTRHLNGIYSLGGLPKFTERGLVKGRDCGTGGSAWLREMTDNESLHQAPSERFARETLLKHGPKIARRAYDVTREYPSHSFLYS